MAQDDKNMSEFSPSPLDPSDWEKFRVEAHRLLDVCVDQLKSARQHPWQSLSPADKEGLRLGEAEQGIDSVALVDELAHGGYLFYWSVLKKGVRALTSL